MFIAEILGSLRQGDFIVIDCNVASRQLDKEEVIEIHHKNQEILYCKIK